VMSTTAVNRPAYSNDRVAAVTEALKRRG